MIACAVVFGLLAFKVQAEAKIEAAKPFAAEQNFNLLKQFGHEEESKLVKDSDLLEEGSGWDEDEYDDEDYDYDEDDEDYYEDDDDMEFGSGDDQILHELPKATEEAKLIPDNHQEDLHFAEDKKKNSDDVEDSDLLYEYYNELLFGEDDQDEDLDYLDEVEKDLGSSLDNDNVKITKNPKDTETEKGTWNLQPSYIFLMLTSALITFAIVVLAFILCRKSMLSRQHKKSMPFVISSVNSHNHHHQKNSPIVKNYQRVPTSTKELMQQQQKLELGLNETQKPLL